MAEFTSDMLIRDVLNHSPDTAEVFERHGLACASCIGSQLDTVSAVASMHEVDVVALLVELNALPAGGAEEE